jgi:hypothetical protein
MLPGMTSHATTMGRCDETDRRAAERMPTPQPPSCGHRLEAMAPVALLR